jgi:hypothetical protein
MSLIDRAKNIIVTPKTEWEAVAAEEPNTGGIITGYVIPLALFAAVAAFIGYGLVGVPVPFFGMIKGVSWGLMYGINSLILTIASVFVTAFVVDLLASSFASEKNFGRSVQLVAYAYTPSWLGGIFAIYPPIAILGSLCGLYGIYLLYLGFPVLKKTPKDKVVIYMILSAVILIVVYAVLGMILMAILTPIFGLSLFS